MPAGTELYKILEVTPDASEADLKKAYRRLAVKYHPDKNQGDAAAAEKFKEISAAYDVLQDPEKKKIYDTYGEEGLKSHMQGGDFSAADVFSRFFGGDIFGGGGGRQKGRGPRKADDTVYKLGVSLKDLYNGRTKKLKIGRNIICAECEGKGATKEGCVQNCKGCKGTGTRVTLRQLGPGMIQQMQQVCPECQGKGETIDPKFRCKKCNGDKVCAEKEIVEVSIDKGMKSGQKVTIYGKGEQQPGVQPGDLIVILEEVRESDDKFQRQGQDLIYQHKVTLSEALTGYEFIITHLDGRTLVVRSQPQEIVKPGDIRVIDNEGMPRYKQPFEKGRLFIKFEVAFPAFNDISKVQKQLGALLPPKPRLPATLPAEHEDVTLREFDPMDHESANGGRGRGGGGHHMQDDDDDDEQGGQQARCVHQ
jgi:DnaJ family protein A protein 2